MPVPYRKTPRPAEIGCAAYLDVVWLPSERALYGGLLLIDGRGQPQEFVHNRLSAPSGFLWPEEQVRALGTANLAHTLFDACEREPDLLLCPASLGSPEFCRSEIAPVIPFARVVPAKDEFPAEWAWVNDSPTPGMKAHALSQELTRRGFVTEPFERLRIGLVIAYPDAPWEEAGRLSPGTAG
jgi:hypothetical protein